MSAPSKPSPGSYAGSCANLYRAAIVGAASLKGKEIAEMLNQRNFPAMDVRLLDDDESLGQLEAMGDEISFIQSVRAEQFDHVDFTFFASDAECTRKIWKRARDSGSAILDLSGALENEPEASVRSLWLERERELIVPPELQPGPCVVAHPAAVTLGLLLLLSSLVAGYHMGEGKARSWIHSLAFVVAIALAFYVILDFEFPRVGIIRIDGFDQVFVELRQSMK